MAAILLRPQCVNQILYILIQENAFQIGKTPVKNYSLVLNNKNAHEGMFRHLTTRARGRVPEMLYIFV